MLDSYAPRLMRWATHRCVTGYPSKYNSFWYQAGSLRARHLVASRKSLTPAILPDSGPAHLSSLPACDMMNAIITQHV